MESIIPSAAAYNYSLVQEPFLRAHTSTTKYVTDFHQLYGTIRVLPRILHTILREFTNCFWIKMHSVIKSAPGSEWLCLGHGRPSGQGVCA